MYDPRAIENDDLSPKDPPMPAHTYRSPILFRFYFPTTKYLYIQVEYAMESVKQGSACVGIRSDTHCVLGALKRSVSELSSHQKKLLKIDDHMGAGIAGLTADARSLAKWMQSECLHHRYVYGQDMPPHRLMADLADKHQRTTQIYVRRPFGVGMLIAAVHRNVPHLFQTCPSGNLYEFYASAIGARSQSARTYLEKHQASFNIATREQLIVHALQALQGCCGGDDELTIKNGSIAIVGRDEKFTFIEGDDLLPYLAQIETGGNTAADEEEEEAKQAEPEAATAADTAPMEES
jgi:20S proteasome subunit alpha 6